MSINYDMYTVQVLFVITAGWVVEFIMSKIPGSNPTEDRISHPTKHGATKYQETNIEKSENKGLKSTGNHVYAHKNDKETHSLAPTDYKQPLCIEPTYGFHTFQIYQ